MTGPAKIQRVTTRWRDTVSVCRKCSKKIHGGFGPDGRTRLDKALRAELGLAKGRRGEIGFIKADCFDICPKKAVTVAVGSRPDRLFIVPRGAPAKEVAALLGLSRPARETPPPDEES